MSWKVKSFNELSTHELYEILQVRTQVFVVEQECPYLEVDGKDLHAHHLYKEENGEVVAYARLLPAGVSYKEPSIGRVLVKEDLSSERVRKRIGEKRIGFHS